MERPIFTQGTFLKKCSENLRAIVRAFSIVLTISLISFNGQAQVNCNTILACNNSVQISLDNDCNMTIDPYMMIQTPTYAADSFDVEAKLPNGTDLPQFTIGFDTRNRPIRRVEINRTNIGMILQVKVSLRGCSNSCWGTAKIEDKLPPEISSCPCEQRITTFSGNVSTPDPDFDRPFQCPVVTSELGVSYKLHNFAVDVTGIVDISLPTTAVKFSLYATTFNPLLPCNNAIATNVNSFSSSLSAGTNYIMVVSSTVAGIQFGGDDYVVYLDSRVGNIKSSVAASVCTFACGSESGILADTISNRPVFLDACSGAAWSPTTTGAGTINFNNSNIVLKGGSSGASTGVVVGAQICFTSAVNQTITFDWATTMLPNISTDSVFYTVNGVPTVLSTSLISGTNVSVFIPAGGVFCFKVNTENAAPDNTLTVSNIKVLPPSPALTYTKRDSVISLLCNERYGKIIIRKWTAADPSGNVSLVKTQYLYVKRGSVDDVQCPPIWELNCNDSYVKLENGAPKPTSQFSPTGIGCENMQVFYDDIVFPVCGSGVKVSRQWTIIDWCTGREKICSQEILVKDNIDPAYTCPVLPSISTDPNKCTATWQVTPPAATDCSRMTWDVYFSKDSVVFVKQNGATKITGDSPPYAATIGTINPPFIIEGLPLGKTWIKYVVRDTCKNFKECITSITVVDRIAPTAICQDETIVSIDDLGWGVLKAQSLNNYSNDNCDVNLRFEVRRKSTTCPGYASDTIFKPEIRFCCSDVTIPESYIAVVLRVYDSANNYNECETVVKVQNKRPPSINCSNIPVYSMQCGDPNIAAWIAGIAPYDTKPLTTGVCSNLQVASRILPYTLNTKCNTGTITRMWYLLSDTTQRCFNTLTIIPTVFNASSVTFRGDTTLATCDLGKATPDLLNNKPVVSNLGCRDIGLSFTDQVFRDVPGACVKILRTWRVIDWCSYATTPYIAEQTQKILLTGSGGAVFPGGCNNRTLTADEGKCDKVVTLSVSPQDDCTDEEQWKYSWSLDLYKDNVIDDNGITKSTTQTLPSGVHRISFTVTNICGTKSTCAYDITILSNKKPTPVCFGELVWVMDPSGSVVVWASDFIQSTSTNICGRIADFDYYVFKATDTNISFTTANQSIRLRCGTDIPNGQVNRIPMKVYVRDRLTGLSDFCNVVLILQDSPLTDACPDVPALLPSVGGKISTESKEGINNIEVALKNMSTSNEIKAMTQNEGEYRLNGVDVFDPKSIGAYKNNDVLNGVSTLDLVLIQRHILGIQTIDSPYKLLAADINNSKSISAGDLVALRKVVLGVTNEFENNTSWRFVPSSYVFSDPAYPFDFPEKINLDSIFEDKNNVNFTAIKIGDVNGSVVANVDGSSTEKRSGKAVFASDQKSFGNGDVVKYEIKASENMDILGTQFGLEFNADQLLFTGIIGGAFDIKPQHFNPFLASNGKLSFSYDIPNGVSLNAEDVLFTIEFKAKSAGNTSNIKIDQSTLRPELYEIDATVRPLFLQNRDKTGAGAQNVLFQNEPNPFKDFTNISFELAKASDATIRILDLTGKMVYSQKGKYEKGFNTIMINNSQLNKAGIYYYQIEAGEFSSTKKMILIE